MKERIRHILRYRLFPRLGSGPERSRFAYQKRHIRFDFREALHVLDLGSGAYPFPPATHLVDPFIGATSHRPGEDLVRDRRPLLAAEAESLPFRDGAFDFVYCSHVLEHVPNPARTCEEIMRVGKNGFIEVPTRTSDILFNFTRLENHHRWHILAVHQTLVFFPWNPAERRDLGTRHFYRQFHSWLKNPFQDLVRANRDLFTVMFNWSRRFDFVVFALDGKIAESSFT